jgi:hypothetical protein
MKNFLLAICIILLFLSTLSALGPVQIGGKYGSVSFMYKNEEYYKYSGNGYGVFIAYKPPLYPLSVRGEYTSKKWHDEGIPPDSSIDYTLGLYALYVLQPKPSPVGAFLGAGVSRHQIKYGPLILPQDQTELKGKLGIDFKGGIQVTYKNFGIFFEGEYSIIFVTGNEPLHSQLGLFVGGFI